MSLSSVTPLRRGADRWRTSYRPEVLSRARERASRLTEIAVSGLPEAAEEALATTDACGEGAQ
eukprot:COSAG02_NODE_7049_length_3210_cov_2.725169_3_plen_63_part_00